MSKYILFTQGRSFCKINSLPEIGLGMEEVLLGNELLKDRWGMKLPIIICTFKRLDFHKCKTLAKLETGLFALIYFK